jgi:hypothetical protein
MTTITTPPFSDDTDIAADWFTYHNEAQGSCVSHDEPARCDRCLRFACECKVDLRYCEDVEF